MMQTIAIWQLGFAVAAAALVFVMFAVIGGSR